MTDLIPDREQGEEIRVEVPTPDPNEPDPKMIITAKRKTPIKRQMPLTETHGMTTEANRFRES